LQNRRFSDADAVIEALTDLFDSVTFEELQNVFQNWIERFEWVIRHNGEYFIKSLTKDLLIPSSSRNRRGDITFCTPDTSDSIRVKREFDSNVMDESDLHFEKHFDPRISMLITISIDDDVCGNGCFTICCSANNNFEKN
jgi:hypothetical protein